MHVDVNKAWHDRLPFSRNVTVGRIPTRHILLFAYCDDFVALYAHRPAVDDARARTFHGDHVTAVNNQIKGHKFISFPRIAYLKPR